MEQGQRAAVKLASSFYGRPQSLGEVSCVVTESQDPNWHHLDEARPRWWHYLNIVPLVAHLNQKLDKRAYRYLPVELEPGPLESKAIEHYRRGRFAQGYACARLGAFLALPPRGDRTLGRPHDPDRALWFCASALLSLRPISAVPFAIDTLNRNVIPILESHQSSITPLTAARLIIELGVYLRDYGLYSDAIRCSHLASQYFSDMDNPVERGLRARIAQHGAISAMATRSPSSLDLLDEARAIDGGQLYVEGRANDALWRARHILSGSHSDVDESRDLIKYLYRMKEQKQVAPWTYAEALWTDAEWNLTTGNSSRAYEIVAHGRDLFQNAGIVPTAVLSPHCVQSFKEKYPRDLYVSPRRPEGLGNLPLLTQRILAMLPAPVKAIP